MALTITEYFLKASRDYPDNIVFHYFRDGWETVKYRDFSENIISAASYMTDIGLKKGDRCAIISENRHEWCSAYLSIVMAGGIAVPIDSQLGQDEISNLISDSETIIVFHSNKTSEKVEAALLKTPKTGGNSIILINFDSPEYEMIIRKKALFYEHKTDPEDIASIIYTSGTTGKPKGVMLTHKNFCSDAEAVIDARIVSHYDNVLSILPLHHTYAFMCTFLVPVFLGASITYPESLKGPDLMSAIKDRGVSILIGVPQVLDIIRNGMMKKISDLPAPLSKILLKINRLSGFLREKFDINIGRIIFRSAHKALGGRFRFFASGGARLDPSIMKDLEALGFQVLEGYGLTETSPIVTFNPITKRKPGSAGKPLPSVQIRILNPSETGEGEIAIKGPMVMKGYYKNPSATADVIREDWFMTGDLGSIDTDGYLYITGRSKEVIVLSSGKNIYPEEVEKKYLEIPLIKEICILGMEERGVTESIHAVIVPDFEYAKKQGVSNIQEAMKWEINEISGKMPTYMRIKGYSLRTEPLPRTRLGKLRRFMVKDMITRKIETQEKQIKPEIAPSADRTARKVVEVLSQFLKEDRKINMDDNLELDIGLDSLLKIELTVSLEKTFSIKLTEDFLSDIQTVGDLVEKVKKQSVTGISTETTEKTAWGGILQKEPSETDLQMVSLERPESSMVPAFLAYSILKGVFKVLFRLKAEGTSNIPSDRNFIIAPNHTSYLDGFAVILSLPFSDFKKIYSLGLSDYFTGFLKSWVAKTAHVIPIDSASYLNKALQMSAYVLKNGRSLSVFPEGGRSFDGDLMEFKKGVGILAVEMGIPVVPAYIDGAFESLPRGSSWPKFRKITVIFGKPLLASSIDFSKKTGDFDDYQHFANLLRERVKELKPEND
ncbi:MAG: AMP-binding protein [Nitrospirota bacterium]